MTAMARVTQEQIVLHALQTYPRGVCGVDLLTGKFGARYIPRYAAVVFNLREAGHNIKTVPCPYHSHPQSRGRVAAYRLEPDAQGRLL